MEVAANAKNAQRLLPSPLPSLHRKEHLASTMENNTRMAMNGKKVHARCALVLMVLWNVRLSTATRNVERMNTMLNLLTQ
jgi:hypothetical protein